MRSKGVRRVAVVVALVAVMVVGRIQPAGAFLSALDPAGWAVVAQMAAIISQAVAIKRQVENVRNQARAEFFGKLAPLSGKLSVVSGWLRTARNRAGVSIYNPASSAALLPTTLPEFNRPMDECVAGPVGVNPCMPPITSAALPATVVSDLSTWYRQTVVSSSGLSPVTRSYTAADTRLAESGGRIDRRLRDAIARQEAEAVRGENERAMQRALIEEQMAIVEDWRGCQEAPIGAWNPPPATTDDRLPCMTNDGFGRNDPQGGGTQGAQSDLVAKIDALEQYQDGDVSKVQLDTMQTQLIVMLGRLQAARIERESAALERAQDAAMAAEAVRRRGVELQAQDFQCKARFGVGSRFIENMPSTIPPTGSCLQVRDVSAAVIAAASTSCLIDGRC